MASCEGPALIPGKLYEYLGTGVRIIASVPEGQARRLLERATRGALIVPAEDAAALAAAFVNAYNEKALGLTNYRTVEEEVRAYARPCQVERLAAFLGKWT